MSPNKGSNLKFTSFVENYNLALDQLKTSINPKKI